MSKMTDYQSGREDGLLLAQKIVKEGGIEALDKEIKFRGIMKIHTQLAKKELEKASEQIKLNTLDTVLVLVVSTIHDEFGFGQKRLQRLIDRMELRSSSLLNDMATWEDFRQCIKEEIGIEINTRESAGNISFTDKG